MRKKKIEMNQRESIRPISEMIRQSSIGEGVGALIKKEERETGIVAGEVVRTYFKNMGASKLTFVTLVMLFLGDASVQFFGTFWLTFWTRDTFSQPVGFYIGIYALCNFSNIALNFSKNVLLSLKGLESAKRLHEGMWNALIRAPMQFFHETPIGRILNRFTNDTSNLDKNFHIFLALFIQLSLFLVTVLAGVAIASIYIAIAFIPVLYLFWRYQRYFQATSRELKRLNSITKSPLYEHFTSAINGLSSVVAFRAGNRMLDENARRLNYHIRMTLASFSADRWLSVRLEVSAAIMILSCGIFTIVSARVIDASIAGFALSYAFNVTSSLNWLVRFGALVENNFNAVERLHEYSKVESEAPLTLPARKKFQTRKYLAIPRRNRNESCLHEISRAPRLCFERYILSD